MEPDPDEHQHPGLEDLAWDNEEVKVDKPKGLYSHASEMAQNILSGEQQCSLFCGGKKCKYCKGESWAPDEKAIKGLYSHWVTDNILAMARPSNHGIEKHNFVQQFIDAGINSIVNLQIAGEHADCGPHKLDPSGFLYNPQAFMEKGVFFYNFGWPDYGVASLSTILDMVKVMQFAVSQGKVAVHCHAGRGRTGVIIACYLVFTNRISGREAIHYVREKRPGSIQTRQQMQVIQEFEQYLQPFRTVYAARHRTGSLRQKGSHEFSLQQYLNRQRHILHGYEARRLKFVPKIIYTVCERLLELARKGSSLQRQLDKGNRDRSQTELKPTFSTLSTTTVKAVSPDLNVKQSASKDSLLTMGKRRKKPSLLSLGRSRQMSVSMEDLDDDKFKSVLDEPERQSIGSSNSGVFTPAETDENDDDDDDKSIVWGNSVTDLKVVSAPGPSGIGKPVSPKVNGRRSSPQSDVTSQTGTESSMEPSIMTEDMSEDHVQQVAVALSTNKMKDYVPERTSHLEDALNSTDKAWENVSTEGDPHVLGLLLWDWLDQLKEPVLRVQDLHILLEWVDEPQVGLQKIEKGPRHTIEYLVRVISKLRPIEERTLLNLYEKLLSHLTHQWVVYGDDDDDGSNSWVGSTRTLDQLDKDHWSEMRPRMAERLFLFFHNLQDALHHKHKNH